jgi:hypothetical protein
MNRMEANAARRSAELQWQHQTRQADARKSAAEEPALQALERERLAIAARTARLRMLRLSKEAAEAEKELGRSKPKRRKTRGADGR